MLLNQIIYAISIRKYLDPIVNIHFVELLAFALSKLAHNDTVTH